MDNNDELILLRSLSQEERKTIEKLFERKKLERHQTLNGVAFSKQEFIKYMTRANGSKECININLSTFAPSNYVYKRYKDLSKHNRNRVSNTIKVWYIDENGEKYFDIREVIRPITAKLAMRIGAKTNTLIDIICDGMRQKYIDQHNAKKTWWNRVRQRK